MVKTKNKHLLSFHRVVALTALVLLVLLAVHRPIDAQTVAEGYASSQSLQKGMLVSLSKTNKQEIVPTTLSNVGQLKGVVINPTDSAVTLSTGSQKTFVATVGDYSVLVSDENGPINTGDYVTGSDLAGIGMKAGSTQQIVIGRAVTAFNGKSQVISSVTAKSVKGQPRLLHIGMVTVNIGIMHNPLNSSASTLPSFLSRFASGIAKKAVDPFRVYLGLVVFIGTVVLSGIIMYSGIRSSIISLGRNPLSKKLIARGLLQVVLAGIFILLVGLSGVYFILKL